MDGLEILNTETSYVAIGHFEGAMSENPLKKKRIATILQITDREGVAKRMSGETYPRDVQLTPQPLKFMQDVSRMATGTVPCREDECVRVLLQELKQHFPQSNGHRQHTFPPTFSANSNEEIIEVEVFPLQ